jgi:hypothetical protein
VILLTLIRVYVASPTGPYPRIYLVPLELPKTADPMAGHALVGDLRVHGVLADAEVLLDFLYRQPTVIRRIDSPGWSGGYGTHRSSAYELRGGNSDPSR